MARSDNRPAEDENRCDLPASSSLSKFSVLSEYLDVERAAALRTSSLRSPNSSSAEKKVVSFADAMGFDLCQVKSIFPYNSNNSSDSSLSSYLPPSASIENFAAPPTSCNSSSSNKASTSNSVKPTTSTNTARFLHLLSKNPFSAWQDPHIVYKQLQQKARTNGVCLKSSHVCGTQLSGIVIVRNIAYHKKVYVRYTLDDWHTHCEIEAQYVTSCDGIDSFSFCLFLPHNFPVNARCQFCIRYSCNSKDYWDNNDGYNYVLECRSLAEMTHLSDASTRFY